MLDKTSVLRITALLNCSWAGRMEGDTVTNQAKMIKQEKKIP